MSFIFIYTRIIIGTFILTKILKSEFHLITKFSISSIRLTWPAKGNLNSKIIQLLHAKLVSKSTCGSRRIKAVEDLYNPCEAVVHNPRVSELAGFTSREQPCFFVVDFGLIFCGGWDVNRRKSTRWLMRSNCQWCRATSKCQHNPSKCCFRFCRVMTACNLPAANAWRRDQLYLRSHPEIGSARH